jgi:antitoxin ParD1/3/4
MSEMHINLPETMTAYIQAQVTAGRYTSVSDYFRGLVHADQQQQHVIEQLKGDDRLEAFLEEGFRSGEGRRWTASVLAELRKQVLDRDRRVVEDQ